MQLVRMDILKRSADPRCNRVYDALLKRQTSWLRKYPPAVGHACASIAPFQQRMRRIQAYPRKTFKLRVPGNHRTCMRSDLSVDVKLEQTKLERCFRQISRG